MLERYRIGMGVICVICLHLFCLVLDILSTTGYDILSSLASTSGDLYI